MNNKVASFLLISVCLFSGCSALQTTGSVVGAVGKVGWKTAKVTAKVAKTTGKVAWKTGKVTSKAARTVIYMAKGKQIIPLRREGNSFYANVRLNRKVRASFLVDTGASSMQISRAMAAKLGIRSNQGEAIRVNLAGGHVVAGRKVILKEVRLGKVRIKRVEAIVLDQDQLSFSDGLLGMSFLNHFIFQINTKKPELILQRRVE